MPLDSEPIRYGDADSDQGLFAVLQKSGYGQRPVAMGIRAAREALELDTLPPDTTVYRGHWGTCTKAERFRR